MASLVRILAVAICSRLMGPLETGCSIVEHPASIVTPNNDNENRFFNVPKRLAQISASNPSRSCGVVLKVWIGIQGWLDVAYRVLVGASFPRSHLKIHTLIPGFFQV